MNVRSAHEAEIGPLAGIWFNGWRDAHELITRAELTRDRTLESFKIRPHEALADVRVTGSPGEPSGFCVLKDDELHQLYVSRPSRGVAAALLADAEALLAERGVK